MAGVFWVIILKLAKFAPTETELAFRYGIIHNLPHNLLLLRLPNLILGLIFLGIVAPIAPPMFPILAAVSLGVFWVILTDLPMAIMLVVTTGCLKWMIYSKNRISKIIFGIWLLLTIIYRFQIVTEINWSEEVDMRAKNEFQINNYRTVVPLILKRLAYNKYYFRLKENAEKVIGIFSWERWSFPGQADATVIRSLWNSKGLPWIFFWQIPLAFWTITRWRQIDQKVKKAILIFGGWGIILINLGKPEMWLENGVGLMVAVLMLNAEAYKRLNKPVKILMNILLVVYAIPAWWHFLTAEEVWRDNRPMVQTQMAQLAIKHDAKQVTSILGGSVWYMRWLNENKSSGMLFEHFEKPTQPGVYIGLPGEFLGNRADKNINDFKTDELENRYQLIESVKIHDTVSFGNGDYIWAVQVN